ncbi:cobalt-precorrin-5B (C(1))-methyltransferase [Salmonella enterica subsp. enterica serovar Infantis]|nr:cobalt-precorrin-5B (C(1))-methyltransferase [Salmonella enterica subsp. enterica serovar Infantis]
MGPMWRFLPRKAKRGRKTYNSRLGILGGISIIGTTGIVTPMSEESWKRSLSLELEIKRASGLTRVILVPATTANGLFASKWASTHRRSSP